LICDIVISNVDASPAGLKMPMNPHLQTFCLAFDEIDSIRFRSLVREQASDDARQILMDSV